ncbi:sugar phosphate transporter [Chloropicon roscoffensis]|uniref:Sugar phosphate transporter n=2 Tax=Chloropicon roscoffensis TaxID=1461544 RepID=A0AAX4P4S8_9CHLO
MRTWGSVVLCACFLSALLSLPLSSCVREDGTAKEQNLHHEVWSSPTIYARRSSRKPGGALSAQSFRATNENKHAENDDDEVHGGEGRRRSLASWSLQRSLDIYWINPDKSVDRRASMESMLKSARAFSPTVTSTRVPGIDVVEVREMLRLGRVKLKEGLAAVRSDSEAVWKKNFRNEYTDLQFACVLGHLKAIKRAYDDNSELALIIEDDVVVPESFLESWESYAAMAPPDWTVLQWYNGNPVVTNASLHYQEPWISWMPGNWGTQAYMINREGMERILRGMQSDDSADWYFDDDVVVADELLYALAGRTYTATRTLGIQHKYGVTSLVRSNNPEADAKNKVMAVLQTSDTSMAQITPRRECILVLTNCLIKTEERLNDDIAMIASDMRALAQWNPCSKWKVNFVVRPNLKMPFAKKLQELMEQGNLEPFVRYTSSHAPFNKYAFMKPLVPQMQNYDYVLLKDVDQRIAGFPWNTFMEKKGDSVVSGPLRQVVGESLVKGHLHPPRQHFKLHDARYWKRVGMGGGTNRTDFISVEPQAAEFIEQYFALLEGRFASQFFNLVLTNGFLNQQVSWGPDLMWCGAAADMHLEQPACSLIPVVSEHLDTREIERVNENGITVYCPCTPCPCKKEDLPKNRPHGVDEQIMVHLLHNVFDDTPLFERWIFASQDYRINVASQPFPAEDRRTRKENVRRIGVTLVRCALFALLGSLFALLAFVGIEMFRRWERIKVILPQMASESNTEKMAAMTMLAEVIMDVWSPKEGNSRCPRRLKRRWTLWLSRCFPHMVLWARSRKEWQHVRKLSFSLSIWYVCSLVHLLMLKTLLSEKGCNPVEIGLVQMSMTALLGGIHVLGPEVRSKLWKKSGLKRKMSDSPAGILGESPLGGTLEERAKWSGRDHSDQSNSVENLIRDAEFWKQMVVLGALRGSTIILGLVSLSYVAASFTETIKASSPLVTVLFSWMILGEQTSLPVVLSLLPVMGGLVLCTSSELSFHTIGFLAVLLNNVLDCIQNILSKKMMKLLVTPVQLQFFTSVVGMFFLLPALLWQLQRSAVSAETKVVGREVAFYMLIAAVLFHAQSVSAYCTMSLMSPVSMSVANTLKRTLMIFISILYFHNTVGVSNVGGILMVVGGVALYNYCLIARRPRSPRQREGSRGKQET